MKPNKGHQRIVWYANSIERIGAYPLIPRVGDIVVFQNLGPVIYFTSHILSRNRNVFIF